jgi:hypothetical protein
MTRKEELTHEITSLSRNIDSYKDSISISQHKIKFMEKRLAVVMEELNSLPPDRVPADPFNNTSESGVKAVN